MKDTGLLVVVSGPAGSGKGTVNAHLLATGEYEYSVSATTRAPRPGEVDGVNYHYVTREAFEQALAEDGMLEHTEYCGFYYGTPRARAQSVLDAGKNLLLEIEVDGAMQIKAKCPDAVLIMLLPPSHAEQEKRLRGRATETEEKILARLKQARTEIEFLPRYDYVVYNMDGGAEQCAEDIRAILHAIRHPEDAAAAAQADRFATRNHPNAIRDFLGEDATV
jgi:guanylate kinase